MLTCPGCKMRLTRRSSGKGVVYLCTQCGGRAVALSVLRKEKAAGAFLRNLWGQAREGRPSYGRNCPHCNRRMVFAQFPQIYEPLVLDVCVQCQIVWFDKSEYEEIPRSPAGPGGAGLPKLISPEAREAAVLLKLESQRRAREEKPISAWQYIPIILGFPIECESPAVVRKPLITWGLSALMAAILFLLLGSGSLDEVIAGWGFIPAQWSRQGGLTIITSFLLHGGIFHLASNLYFLMVFGDNVEDHLGKLRFILLLAGAHLLGTLAHFGYAPQSDIPCVGASAGISGVIAYYAIAFPHAKLGFLIWLWFIPRWFRVSAWGALVMYTFLQLLGSWWQVQGFSGVSYLAHLGGLFVGIVVGVTVRIARRRANA